MTPPEKAAKNHKIKSNKISKNKLTHRHTLTKLDKLKVKKKTYKHAGTINRRDAFL